MITVIMIVPGLGAGRSPCITDPIAEALDRQGHFGRAARLGQRHGESFAGHSDIDATGAGNAADGSFDLLGAARAVHAGDFELPGKGLRAKPYNL